MVAVFPAEVNASAVVPETSQGIASNIPGHSSYVMERMPSKLAIIREETSFENVNQAHEVPSISTSSTPRSSPSTHTGEEELFVLFESKEDYMDQKTFDKIMHEHGIQEEISHRICRVETDAGESIPESLWDDPCQEFFPVRCIYRKIARINPPSPPASIPSSMPSTPEPPMRELVHEDSSIAASLITQQLQAPMGGTATQICPIESCSSSFQWYRVSFCGGICAREGPSLQFPPTGVKLSCNDVFAATESLFGLDQRVYLKLADGPGWVFDDSLLFPADPSVVKLSCAFTPAGESIDMGYGRRTFFATESETPYVHRDACVTVPPHSLAPNPAPPSPHHGSPLATTPMSSFASFRNEDGITMIPLASVPYQVQVPGGISVRVGPSVDAPPTGATLASGEVFHVSESVMGADGRQYLKLADGRGWVLAETVPEQERQPSDPSDPALQGPGKGKNKGKEEKAHVPYWVRLRRAKRTGISLRPQKGKVGAAKA